MAFMAMFLVGIFAAVVIIGAFICLIGIILDIIWAVRAKKKKKVHIVLKIFAIFLTVTGFLTAVTPIALVKFGTFAKEREEAAEIEELSEEDYIYEADYPDYFDGFDFKGKHYVNVKDMHPQSSHDNFSTELIGAVILENGGHKLINKVNNTSGASILRVENYSGLMIEESKVEEVKEYYENDAPLYCESKDKIFNDVDSDHARRIRDMINDEGTYSNGNSFQGYFLFYSTDDLYCFDFTFTVSGDVMMVSSGSRSMALTGEDKDFMMQFVYE